MRLLRFVLAALFLPLCLIAGTPMAAGAVAASVEQTVPVTVLPDAVLYGETRGTANVELDETGYVPWRNATCAVSAYYEDVARASEFIDGSILCHGESMSAWSSSLFGPTSGTTTLSFNGLAGGDECALQASFQEKPTSWGYSNVGVSQEAPFVFQSGQKLYGLGGEPCLVSEVCFIGDYKVDLPLSPDQHLSYDGCSDIDLGDYPQPGGAKCEHGNPARVDFQDFPSQQFGSAYHNHWTDINFQEGSPSQSWNVTFIVAGPGSIDPFATSSHGSWIDSNSHSAHPTGTTRLQSGSPSLHVKGIQITHTSRAQSSSDWGFNDPALCNFYIGEKIRSDPDSERDEPAFNLNNDAPSSGGGSPTAPGGDDVPLPSEPVGNEAACSFNIKDPSSWLSGGMCAVVGLLASALDLLQGIWDAILGIPGQIIAGVRSLFVPQGGALDGAFADIRAAFNDTAPGQWMGAFTGQQFTGSQSGCAGPRIQADLGMASIDVQPFNACSGVMATVAGISKIVLSAGLVIGGSLACLRGLGSGFGWSPGIGKGENT